MSRSIKSAWVNVTPLEPCLVCGKPDWCSRNRSTFLCRRQGTSSTHGVGKQHTDKNGQTYWSFSTQKTSGRSSLVEQPTRSPSPKKADEDSLHRVYSSVIHHLDWTTAAAQELSRRGMSPVEIRKLQQAGYRWLPRTGRSRIARSVIGDCGEKLISQTPGFTVREHEGRKYWTIKGPEGLVLPVRDGQERIVALMVRSLSAENRYRYITSSDKKSGGTSPGSPVHVPSFPVDRLSVRVTEGPLKADITTLKSGVLTIGLPGVGSWRKAAAVLTELGTQFVQIAFDADWRTNPIVFECLKNLVEHLHAHGCQVSVEVWNPEDGKGIDDVLTAGKSVQQIHSMEEIQKLLTDAGIQSQQRNNAANCTDARAKIMLSPDVHIVVDQTLQALAFDPNLYSRSGQLVHVVQEPADSDDQGMTRSTGTPRILSVSSGHLQERLTERCYYFKQGRDGEFHCSPPASIVNAIHTRGFWRQLRYLSGVTEIPVLRPDGTILTSPGWDESTGLLFMPNGDLPELPDNPTKAEAVAAKELLLDVVVDFPFASQAHQSAWLAGLLTILARRAFSGPAPMFLVDANIRGSGKSMLTDIISQIATSRLMPRLSNPESDEETRKRITALALAGDPLVLIDNIGGTLGSASLDAVLTSTLWKDRRLGGNEIVEMPMRAVWFATGNNVMLTGDMSRRICHVRLDSLEENPEERSDFRYPKLLTRVRENRMQLLAASLTILRAFVIAGRPEAGLKPWGSFEGWSDLIRNCVVWIEMDDPGGTRKELAEASDRDAGALRMLFDCWSDIDPQGKGLSASDMVQLLDFHQRRRDLIDGGMTVSVAEKLIEKEREETEGARTALCELIGVSALTSKEVPKIGYKLRRFKGKVIGNRRLECRAHGRNKVNRWQVINVDAGDAGHAAHVLPRHQKFGNDLIDHREIENNKEQKTSPASTVSPAFQGSGSLCPNCGFDSDNPGRLCSTCEN